jgi:hypothetical protein
MPLVLPLQLLVLQRWLPSSLRLLAIITDIAVAAAAAAIPAVDAVVAVVAGQ